MAVWDTSNSVSIGWQNVITQSSSCLPISEDLWYVWDVLNFGQDFELVRGCTKCERLGCA